MKMACGGSVADLSVEERLEALEARVAAVEGENQCLRARLQTDSATGEDFCHVVLRNATQATHVKIGGDGLAYIELRGND